MKLIQTIAVAATLLGSACATTGESKGGSGSSSNDTVWLETKERGVVPAGTELAIQINEEINSDNDVINRPFSGELTQDIRANSGEIMVPRGSPVELTVLKTKEGGTVGTHEMTLAVRAITANGRRYMIGTEGTDAQGNEGLGVNKRTAIYTGGGAAIGAVLGGVVGGERGAVIGGVLGGAAGAATQVLTRGDQVKVPAGTIIEFKLDQNWYLNTAPTQGEPVS